MPEQVPQEQEQEQELVEVLVQPAPMKQPVLPTLPRSQGLAAHPGLWWQPAQ
ncbi:hypothetical protein [Arthrobacter sp. NPDC092385]|uniref:hypothetical protein n=1 Tax=Arthrobacter sp. NPDC092385 TaxID=3363943 RepID=UPI00380F5711